MQEQQNNNTNGIIDTQIEGMLEQMKADISKQVKQELQEKGVSIIDNSYDGFKDVVKLMDTYDSKLEKIQAEIKHNEETYSDSVCKVKNYELHLDEEELKQDTLKDLDEVIAKVEKLRDRAIKDAQASVEYKTAKQEVLNIISLLANIKELPTDVILETIEPLTKSSDTKALRICELILQDPMAKYTVQHVIDEIKIAGQHRELNAMIEVMRQVVNTGEKGLSYVLWMNRVRGDK